MNKGRLVGLEDVLHIKHIQPDKKVGLGRWYRIARHHMTMGGSANKYFLTNERNIFDKPGSYFCTFCTGSSEALE